MTKFFTREINGEAGINYFPPDGIFVEFGMVGHVRFGETIETAVASRCRDKIFLGAKIETTAFRRKEREGRISTEVKVGRFFRPLFRQATRKTP